MDPQLIKRIVEAALLAANQPLTVVQLQGLFPLDEPAPDGSIAQAIESLQADCTERGVELVEVASGWRYQVKADVHPWVARLWTERQTRYTRATLETLALIAYRQPITRGEIEQVRGVAVNSNIIKALEEREWIRVVGHRDIPGRPELLGTTKAFLDYFNLKRLDELPPLSELKDFGELDPQLQLDGKSGDAMPVGDIASGDDGDDGEVDGEVDADADGDGDGEDTRGEDARSEDEVGATDAIGSDTPDASRDDTDADAGTDTAELPASDVLPDSEPEPEPEPEMDPGQPVRDDTNTDALAVEGDSTGASNE